MFDLRHRFQTNGVEVTSGWLDVDFTLQRTNQQLGEEARKDLNDIEKADVFILYNPISHQRKGSGGRHVEMGYAIAINKPIIVVGEVQENVFQYLPELMFLTWEYNNHMNMLADALLLMLRENAELCKGSGTV